MPERDGLGGRLPLLNASELNATQHEVYDYISSSIVPKAADSGFRAQDDVGHLIGPFTSVLFSPEMCRSFLEFQFREERSTSLSKRVRQVVILTVGSVWKAAYELYAHSAVARKVGFSPGTITALTAGHPGEEFDQQELLAQRFTRELVQDYSVTDATYQAAQNAFGDRALVEMVVLAGAYLNVCALLNAFAVPVPGGAAGDTKEMKR